MKLCLLGAQGTGKSTLLKEYKEKYNSRYPVIDGIARKVIKKTGTGNEFGTVTTQRQIYNDYYQAMTEKEEFLSTRSVIDVVAYTQYLYIHEKRWFRKLRLYLEYKRQLRKTINWLNNNSNIAICFIPVEFEIEDDGVRSINKEYQKEISQLMSNLWWYLPVKQRWVISGDIDTRVYQLENVVKIVESQDKFSLKKKNNLIYDIR